MIPPRSQWPMVSGALVVVCALLFAPTTRARAQIVINEIAASNRGTAFDDEGDTPDWVELLNRGETAVDLLGYSLSDDTRNPRRWVLPAHRLEPGERLLVWCSGKDRTSPSAGVITQRDSPIPFHADFVEVGAEWSYLTGPPEEVPPPEGWATFDFDDAGWGRGATPIGFGEDEIATLLPEGIGTVYMRHRFRVEDPASAANLIFSASYDDGAVVYLNGVRVADINYTDESDPLFSSTARSSREARAPERADLSEHRDLLRQGDNVLAIALLNQRSTSLDLVMAPELGTVPPVFHTNFELASEGDSFFVTDPEGVIVDAIVFPEQAADRSYGRFPDGSGEFHYMLLPTPDAPNDSRISDELIPNEVRFDPPGGRYEGTIDLTLTANIPFPGFEIRYTATGDLPTANATLYEGPIEMRRESIIRAAGFIDGRAVTSVVSHTYWGQTATSRLTLPVFAISMNVADFNFVHITEGARGRTSERPGFGEIFDLDGNRVKTAGLGLRLHGGAGRGGGATTKKSYKVYFRGEYGDKRLDFPLIETAPIDSFDKLVLRGGFNDAFRTGGGAAYIRDEVIRVLHGEMGCIYSHGTWYNLLVNGRYRGIYNIVERMDKVYFASYFPEIGEEWDVIKTGEDILDGTNVEWTRMKSFFSRTRLDQDPDGRLYEEAAGIIDIPCYTAYMILNMWAQNHDWPHNNWYAARPRVPDGKWNFLSWDAEFGIGRVPEGFSSDTFAHVLGRADSPAGLVFNSLLRSTRYQRYFIAELDRYLEGALSSENVTRLINEQASLIADDMPEEVTVSGNSVAVWNANVNAMRTFAARRPEMIRNFVHNSSRFSFPRVTSVSPRTLRMEEETEVELRGTNLSENTAIRFNDLPAVRTEFVSARSILAVVPYDIRLAGSVSITTDDPDNGTSTTTRALTVSFTDPEPRSLEPDVGAAGDIVVIRGSDFLDGIRVEFGGVPSPSVTRVGDGREELLVVVPPGEGTVEVTITNTRPGDVPARETFPFTYGASAGPAFLRGDTDGNGTLNISDAVRVLNWLTSAIAAPPCLKSFDADDTGEVEITDAIVLLQFLFRDGGPPAAPFGSCGRDPTEDALACDAPLPCSG